MSDSNETPFEFSRPVVVDASKIEIDDLELMARVPFVAPDDAMGQLALMGEIVGFLRRVVEGGTAGRPSTEFWPLFNEVQRQLTASRKN